MDYPIDQAKGLDRQGRQRVEFNRECCINKEIRRAVRRRGARKELGRRHGCTVPAELLHRGIVLLGQASLGGMDVRVARGLHPHPELPLGGELDVMVRQLGGDNEVLIFLEDPEAAREVRGEALPLLLGRCGTVHLMIPWWGMAPRERRGDAIQTYEGGLTTPPLLPRLTIGETSWNGTSFP